MTGFGYLNFGTCKTFWVSQVLAKFRWFQFPLEANGFRKLLSVNHGCKSTRATAEVRGSLMPTGTPWTSLLGERWGCGDRWRPISTAEELGQLSPECGLANSEVECNLRAVISWQFDVTTVACVRICGHTSTFKKADLSGSVIVRDIPSGCLWVSDFDGVQNPGFLSGRGSSHHRQSPWSSHHWYPSSTFRVATPSIPSTMKPSEQAQNQCIHLQPMH